MTKKEQSAKITREMCQHVASWKASKKTSLEYCAGNGWAVYKLYYWLHKIKNDFTIFRIFSTGSSAVLYKILQKVIYLLPLPNEIQRACQTS